MSLLEDTVWMKLQCFILALNAWYQYSLGFRCNLSAMWNLETASINSFLFILLYVLSQHMVFLHINKDLKIPEQSTKGAQRRKKTL